jgi:RES domain-containing protein
VRFAGLAYRAHDPRWSFRPLSGEGAAVHGGRFNPRGTPALYLALDPMTAIKEASQGFAHKLEPCVLRFLGGRGSSRWRRLQRDATRR